MIRKVSNKKMPGWADNFLGKLMASVKGEEKPADKAKITDRMTFARAKEIGFVKNAKKIADGVYEDGGIIDMGSIWYLEFADDGTQYFAKQVDEIGNIVRRAGKGKKRIVTAKKKVCYVTKNLIKGLKQKIADCFEYDSKGLCEKKAEVDISYIDKEKKDKWQVEAGVKVFSAIGDKKWVDIYDANIKYDVRKDRIGNIQYDKKNSYSNETVSNIQDKIINLENAYTELEKKAQAEPVSGSPSEQMAQVVDQLNGIQQTMTGLQMQMEETEQQLQPTSSMDKKAEDAEVMASNIYNEYSKDNTVTDRIRKYVSRIIEYGADVVKAVVAALKQMIPDDSILAEMGLTMGTMAYKDEDIDAIVVRNREAQQVADMEKDIPVEEPVEEVKEVEEKEEEEEKPGEPEKKPEEAPEETVINFADIKSQLWIEKSKEVLNESIDLDSAAFDFYNKLIFGMNEMRNEGKITDEQFRTMTNELDDMKDEGTFVDYLKQMIIEAPEDGEEEEAEEEEAAMPIAASLNKKAEGEGITHLIENVNIEYDEENGGEAITVQTNDGGEVFIATSRDPSGFFYGDEITVEEASAEAEEFSKKYEEGEYLNELLEWKSGREASLNKKADDKWHISRAEYVEADNQVMEDGVADFDNLDKAEAEFERMANEGEPVYLWAETIDADPIIGTSEAYHEEYGKIKEGENK